MGPLERYRLPAARLLMTDPELSRYVPARLRHQVKAEERDREEAARQAVQRRIDEAERARRAEERWQAAEFKRVADSVTAWLYAEARWRAMAVRGAIQGADLRGGLEGLGAEWPGPKTARTGGCCRRTCWWLPSSCGVPISGKANVRPAIEHLLPDIDYSKPWPWRSDAVADRAGS